MKMSSGTELAEHAVASRLQETNDVRREIAVTFDRLDSMLVWLLPKELESSAREGLHSLATSLANQGARGPACREILAKDIALQRVELRCLQGLFALASQRAEKGECAERRALLFDRLLTASHRRLMSSLEMLLRLDGVTPVVQIRTAQTAVVVGEQR